MTMVMVTAVAMTRERERGTFENLLATPAQRFRGDAWKNRALNLGGLRPVVAHPARPRFIFCFWLRWRENPALGLTFFH
jgi:ABC-2 type transport system permease protein